MDPMCVSCLTTDKALYLLQKPEVDIFRYLLNVLDTWDEEIFKFCHECKDQLHSVCEFQKKAQKSFNIFKLRMGKKQSVSNENVGKIKVKEEFSCKDDPQNTEVKLQQDVLEIKLEDIHRENVHRQPGLVVQPKTKASSTKPKIKKRLTRSRSQQLMRLRRHRKQTSVNTDNLTHSDDDNHLDDDNHQDDDNVIVKSSQMSKDDIDSEETLSASEKCDSDSESVEGKVRKKVKFMLDPLKETNIEPLYPITTKGQEQEMQSWTNFALTDREVILYREEDIKSIAYVKKPHKCSDCIISFWEERPLAKHIEKMHSENAGPFQCSICKSRYVDKIKMEFCQVEHKTMYKCMKCKFSTRNFKHIKKHHAVEHSNIRYNCEECEARFVTYDLLVKHKLRKHKSHFPCKCGESFKTYSKYYTHRRKTHLKQLEEISAPRKCHLCQKLYRLDDSLRAHINNAHGCEPVYCVKCDYTFKSRHIYKNHFKYSKKHHAGEEFKYQCDKCEKRFQTSTQFNSHYKNSHLRQGEQHQCEQCPKKFAFKRSLKYHVSRAHGNYVKVRDKICDVCGKAFEGMKILQSHMVTHTGERPYKCELCPSTFGFKAALYTHNKLVHEKVKRVWPKKKKKQTSDNVV